ITLPVTPPATAPSTPPTTAPLPLPTVEPATPPTTPPAAAPTPLCEPSTVTSRVDSTTPSSTLDRRCASSRLMTSGLVVEHAPSSSAAAAANKQIDLMNALLDMGRRYRRLAQTQPSVALRAWRSVGSDPHCVSRR